MFLHDLYNNKNIFETISPIDLAEVLFNALQEKYPEVVTRYGHEVVGNAVMDRAEDAVDIHSMSDVAIAVQEIIDDLENYQGDRTNDIEPEQELSEYDLTQGQADPVVIVNRADGQGAQETGKLSQLAQKFGVNATQLLQQLKNNEHVTVGGYIFSNPITGQAQALGDTPISEDLTRRDLLKGAGAAAAIAATGSAAAGEYQSWNKWKDPNEIALWDKRFDQLAVRFNRVLARLFKVATPEQQQKFKGYKYEIADVMSYAGHDLDDKVIKLDLSVYWDLSDDTIAYSVAHELGHAFYQHRGYDVNNPKENYNKELLADVFGVKLALKAGYDPAKCFGDFTEKEKELDQGDDTHPSYKNRVNHIKQQLGVKVSHIQRGITVLNQLAKAEGNNKQGVAEGSDDIEDTQQFRNAIALAKSQKAIRQARYGKDQKFYADGTPVTPEEVARRAAERKAKKKGVAEAANAAQQAAIAIAMKKAGKKPKTEEQELEENLRKWFKEKWVRFGPDGKIKGDCARGSDSEGKPKCLPQAKAHALGKKGRATAARRKRKEDPNPERKGKAINVKTKESKELCPECGGPIFTSLLLAEKQDACYRKVKSRYKVWPSAYASGALVQCRKKGAANWGNKKKTNEAKESPGQDYQKMMNFVQSQRLSGVPPEQQVAVALFKELEKTKAYNKQLDAELKAAGERADIGAEQGELATKELGKHRGELEKEKIKQQASKQQLQTLAQQLDQLKAAPDIDPEATAAIERQIAELEQKMQEPSGTGIDASKIAELEQAINDVQQGETVDADAIKRLEQQFKAAEEAAKAAQGRVTQAKDYEAAIAKLNAEIDNLTKGLKNDSGQITALNAAVADVVQPTLSAHNDELKQLDAESGDYEGRIQDLEVQIRNLLKFVTPTTAQTKPAYSITPGNTAQYQQASETRFYFTPKATLAETLRSEFKMKQDKTGWYLTVDQGRGVMLEAHRAFGIPKIKQVKLKEYNLAAFSGSANIIGDDNPVSPIGSKSLPGRKNA